jgi:hypothetical protein
VWSFQAAGGAERFQVSVNRAKRWADRYRVDGAAGMADRSSRPQRSPSRTAAPIERKVVHLRAKRRWGPARVGGQLGLAGSTCHAILRRAGVARLPHLDRATREPIRRYEHASPGDLVHVDIEKRGNTPDGGGWRPRAAPALVHQPRHHHRPAVDRQRLLLQVPPLARHLHPTRCHRQEPNHDRRMDLRQALPIRSRPTRGPTRLTPHLHSPPAITPYSAAHPPAVSPTSLDGTPRRLAGPLMTLLDVNRSAGRQVPEPKLGRRDVVQDVSLRPLGDQHVQGDDVVRRWLLLTGRE